MTLESNVNALAARLASEFAAVRVDTKGSAIARRGDLEVSAREWGVYGDGTDETAALQAFITYLADNGKAGVLPDRDYRISSALIIPKARGWSLRGMGPYRGTNIIQLTDNTPILRIGVGGSGPLREWSITNICLTYNTAQPSTNTAANVIYFEDMPYQFVIDNVYFRNGYYGIAYLSGVGGAWGGNWPNIIFGSMSGGWIDMNGTINAVPNNRFGRIYGDAATATNYLFRQFRGYNTTIDTIEVINYNVGTGLMDFTTGSSFMIGTFKLEGGTFSTAGPELVRIPAGAYIKFDEFKLLSSNGGLYITPASGDATLFALNSGGTSVSTLDIGFLDVTATTLTNGYLFKGTQRTAQVFVKRLDKTLWKIANSGSGTTVNENIQIDQWMNKRLSFNKGNASVTVVPGETETTIFFETPFTAVRDVALPSDTTDLIGGLQYRIYYAENVVNGAFTGRITVPGIRVVYTKTTSIAEVVTVEWRRNATGANGWVVTSVSPAAAPAPTADTTVVRSVTVSTGSEVRPPGSSVVMWIGGSAKPSLMQENDLWFAAAAGTAPAITTASPLNSMTAGSAFTQTLQATGTAPITWSIQSGALPTGLTLAGSTGVISGTPSATGSYSVVIAATNGYGSVTKTFAGTVAASGTAPTITTGATALPAMTQNSAYDSGPLAATGSTPITWGAISGLPAGLAISSSTGALTGTPTGTGAYSIVIRATNAFGTNDRTFTGTIAAAGSGTTLSGLGPNYASSVTPTRGTDGGGSLRFGTGFYSTAARPSYSVVGVRLYRPAGEPAFAALGGTAYGYALTWPSFSGYPTAPSTPTQSKTFGAGTAGTPQDILFDTPIAMHNATEATDGNDFILAAISLTGGNDYLVYANAHAQTAGIQSPQAPGLYLAGGTEGRAWNSLGAWNGLNSLSWYGVDVLIAG